ncbi:hypothetical protein B0H14DRAFT_974242 [Mycena olivaceomarginata]|nr:hypothetical protein B0H14DRAFT_974242 [Mycena olivaceomarginata]
MGGPTPVRARERRGRWTMVEAEGRVEADGWGAGVSESLVPRIEACVRRPTRGPSRQRPCSNICRRRPHRAPAQRCPRAFLPVYIDTAILPPLRLSDPCPPSAARCFAYTSASASSSRRQHRPPLVRRSSSTAHPSSSPPSVAASHTRLTAQPSRRKCVGESGSGRPGRGIRGVSARAARGRMRGGLAAHCTRCDVIPCVATCDFSVYLVHA